MSVRDEPWPHGTPCWMDLAVDDVDREVSFYSGLFGWDVQEGQAEAGGYRMCLLDGRAAAGLGPKQQPGMPTVWTTYLASDDVGASVSLVEQAGGQVLTPTMDVLGMGRMAIGTDPTGAAFGIWQALRSHGAEVVNQPGAMIWNEAMSSDHQAAARFYTDVFGYTYTDMSGDGFEYLLIRRPDEPEDATTGLGGIGRLPPGSTAPAHWLAYVGVADTDATVDAAAAAGAQVLSPASDSPYGRAAVLAGPEGEVFAVIST